MTAATAWRSDRFLLLLLGLFGALSIVIVYPYLQAILAAGLLAYLLAPIGDRLVDRLGRTTGALLTVLVLVLIVLVPVALLAAVAVDQAVAFADGLRVPDEAIVETILQDHLGVNRDLSSVEQQAGDAAKTAFAGLLAGFLGFLAGVPALVVNAVVFFFALFYFIRDGDRLVDYVREIVPLDAATTDELLERTDDLLWAAVVGNVIVAALQAVLTVMPSSRSASITSSSGASSRSSSPCSR